MRTVTPLADLPYGSCSGIILSCTADGYTEPTLIPFVGSSVRKPQSLAIFPFGSLNIGPFLCFRANHPQTHSLRFFLCTVYHKTPFFETV